MTGRRNFTRVAYSSQASVCYGSNIVTCKTSDISLHGLFLKTDHEIPINIPVHVTVYHPKKLFKVNAQVIRRDMNGVGLQIDNLSVSAFVKLRDIVAESCNDDSAVMLETLQSLKSIY